MSLPGFSWETETPTAKLKQGIHTRHERDMDAAHRHPGGEAPGQGTTVNNGPVGSHHAFSFLCRSKRPFLSPFIEQRRPLPEIQFVVRFRLRYTWSGQP